MEVVRFAPSPTGYLHIGGARTCLFNWLYARNQNGKFILRIEDTDRERSKKEYLDEILESIKWLGMDWDEIYYQSERFNIYREYAEKLIKENKAYIKDGAIFFKYEFKRIEIEDLVKRKIVFNELPKEEEVIIKSDGFPTYNFACVIDDALLGITTVIRGEDHISNTPKQILLYEALNFNIPKFAHIPLILSPDGGRLSKRFGATSIREYKNMGYLSEAIANYLMLLSWYPPNNKEILTLDEAKKIFNIKDVNKSNAIFSLEKLDWVNSVYIKSKDIKELTKILHNYLIEKDFFQTIDLSYLEKVVFLFKERLTKLEDFIERARFCFYDDFTYDQEAKEILNKKDLSNEINILIERLNNIDDFNKETIEKEFRALVSSLNLKTSDLIHPTRVAISGKRVGPGLFETMEVLGKSKVLDRLKRLISYYEKKE